MATQAFWMTYRDALIQQYRAAVGADGLPSGFADTVLRLVRVIETHINEIWPNAPVRAFNPTIPSAKQRRGRRGPKGDL